MIRQGRQIKTRACALIVTLFSLFLFTQLIVHFYDQLKQHNGIASAMNDLRDEIALMDIRISQIEKSTGQQQSMKVRKWQPMKSKSKVPNQKYINPEIENTSDHKHTMEEKRNSLLPESRTPAKLATKEIAKINDTQYKRSNVTNNTLSTSNNNTSKPRIKGVATTANNIGQTTHARNMTINDFWMPEKQDFKRDLQKLSEMFNKKNKNHKTLLITTQKCKHHYQLLILITSHATNFKRRNAIRNTWGRDPLKDHPRWRIMFLIGRPDNSRRSPKLLSEIQRFDDVVLGNIDEDFYRLTYKVQIGFEWSVRYCSYDFLLKSDDDVFVNMPQLFSFVKDLPKKEIYAGNVHYDAPVQRTGRYGLSREEFPKDMYPRYCSGGGYLLSRDVVEKFIPAFFLVQPISIDDAYIGLLALNIGVDVLASEFFKMEEKECQFRSQYVVVHPVKSNGCMIKLFNKSLTEVTPETEI